jgi:small subunit ribosomal protein S20
MPKKKSALKRLKADRKRRLRNLRVKSELKRLAKEFRLLLSEKSLQQAETTLKRLARKLDKAQAKGIIHKNSVARKKSRLQKKLNDLRLSLGAS